VVAAIGAFGRHLGPRLVGRTPYLSGVHRLPGPQVVEAKALGASRYQHSAIWQSREIVMPALEVHVHFRPRRLRLPLGIGDIQINDLSGVGGWSGKVVHIPIVPATSPQNFANVIGHRSTVLTHS